MERNKFRSTSGFTLVEMLIVIGIMLVLVTAVATMMPSATESRRIREAARGVNIYLSSARNRAMETGRPCGVTFRFFTGTPCAMNADQCEVPPPFGGDTDTSTATVTGGTATLDASLPMGIAKKGDLIQFNYQGPMYTIDATVVRNGYIVSRTLTLAAADANQNKTTPWATTASPQMPYRILRSPVTGGATPLQLPARTVVDLDFSSSGNNLGSGMADLTVVFSPTGSVAAVNGAPVTDTVYILIGRRDRVATFTPLNKIPPATKQETELTNVEDLNNLWVTINPQTGLINTEPVAAGATAAAHTTYLADGGSDDPSNPKNPGARKDAMIAAMTTARNLANQAIGMGGR